MRQRGRRSSASNVVVLVATPHPRPPKALTTAQAKIWRAVVGAKPVTWFSPDSWPLLAQYCRHVDEVNWLQAKMDAAKALECVGVPLPPEYREWRKDRESEARMVMAFARSLRLTQQSRYRRETAATAHDSAGGGGPKPWQ